MNKKHILWIIGIACIIFLFIYLATMPRWFSRFDFSETGNIGDTIGGLSAPIIGIIGSILVFVSFQAQLDANKEQSKALAEEKKRLKAERWYQFNMNRSFDLESRLNSIELVILKENVENDLLLNEEPVIYRGIIAYKILIPFLKKRGHHGFHPIEDLAVNNFVFNLVYILSEISVLLIEVGEKHLEFHEEAKEIYKKINLIVLLQPNLLVEQTVQAFDDRSEFKDQLSKSFYNFQSILYSTREKLKNKQ